MSLESLSGNGVLYTDGGRTRLAGIKYQIAHTLPSPRDAESWHGTFTTQYEVPEHETYSVVLEDGRAGACELSPATRAMGGIPAVYHYSFKGDVLASPGMSFNQHESGSENSD